MLLGVITKSSPYKIQVCAPSDTAIDHILTRIYESGLTSTAKEEFNELFVRVSSVNAEVSNFIKPFTLREKCRKKRFDQLSPIK